MSEFPEWATPAHVELMARDIVGLRDQQYEDHMRISRLQAEVNRLRDERDALLELARNTHTCLQSARLLIESCGWNAESAKAVLQVLLRGALPGMVRDIIAQCETINSSLPPESRP